MTRKLTKTAIILNVITSAFYTALLSMSIIDKEWGYAIIAFCLIVCHTVMLREIKKIQKKE